MEPGGIEPLPNPASQCPACCFGDVRATQRATDADHRLSELVRVWPTLTEQVRTALSAMASACAAAAESPAAPSCHQLIPRTLSAEHSDASPYNRSAEGAGEKPADEAGQLPDAAAASEAAAPTTGGAA